jgi:hypothetical protein
LQQQVTRLEHQLTDAQELYEANHG